MPEPIPAPPVRILEDPAAAAALLDPLRRRILEHLSEADSASGVARHLRMPRQKVNYHLREMEKRGLVRLVAERRRGNCTERFVQASARSFALSPKMLGRLAADRRSEGDEAAGAAGGAGVSGAARWTASLSRALRELAVTGEAADATGLELEVPLPSDDARVELLRGLEILAQHLRRKYAGSPPTHRLVAGVQRIASFDLHFS